MGKTVFDPKEEQKHNHNDDDDPILRNSISDQSLNSRCSSEINSGLDAALLLGPDSIL